MRLRGGCVRWSRGKVRYTWGMEFDLPVKGFESQKQFRGWLEKHCGQESGIWLRIYKKDSGRETVSYQEALEEALCFGWIDGQKRTYDEESYVLRFTPRRSRSVWSKRNKKIVARMIKEGKMTLAGIEQVNAAKEDGRWEAAYSSQSEMVMPEDFLKELERRPEAKVFYESLSKANQYAIYWRLVTAKKEETRVRRMEMLLGMLERGETLH